MMGAIPSSNSASYGDLMGKLDPIIDLLRVEKYAKLD
jgi:hypothetical protein